MNSNLEALKYLMFSTLILTLLFGVLHFTNKLNLQHGLSFLGIDKDYILIEGTDNFITNTTNKIYIENIPDECNSDFNKKSIKCLSAIKKEGGYYNGLYFTPN